MDCRATANRVRAICRRCGASPKTCLQVVGKLDAVERGAGRVLVGYEFRLDVAVGGLQIHVGHNGVEALGGKLVFSRFFVFKKFVAR